MSKQEETPPPPLALPQEEDLDEDKKCDYCLLTSASNRNGDPEELLVCKDCQAKGETVTPVTNDSKGTTF